MGDVTCEENAHWPLSASGGWKLVKLNRCLVDASIFRAELDQVLYGLTV